MFQTIPSMPVPGIRKTVDTAVRDFGDLTEVVDLTDQLAIDLPETAEAV